MSKKSQISIFIVVGIVLLLLVLLALYIVRTPSDDVSVIQSKQLGATNLDEFIDLCLKDSSELGLQLLGIQGGKIYLNNYLETYYSQIEYSYFEGLNVLPSIEEMQFELDQYLVNAMSSCVDNFTIFKERGMNIQGVDVKSLTEINDGNINFDITYIVNIDGAIVDKHFTHLSNVDLAKIHSYSTVIIDKIVANPDWLDLTYLGGLDVYSSVIPNAENSVIISFTDPGTQLNGQDFIFLLAIIYAENSAPSLPISDSFSLISGENFNYKILSVDSEGDSFTFSDDTAMFDITDDGKIRFTASVTGTFDVEITVTDSHDNSNSKVVQFIVS